MFLSMQRQLMAMLDRAKQQDAPYFYLKVAKAGQEEREVIINSIDVVESKLEYIFSAYNEDLYLNANPNIKIESFGYLHEYNMVEDFMEEEEA